MNFPIVRIIALSMMLVFASIAEAQVQKWIDSDGKTHYGNTAPSNTKSKAVNNGLVSSAIGSSRVPSSTQSESDAVDTETLGISDPKFKSLSAGNVERVKLYTTSWCGYCKKARAYMAANGIKYQEFDIESDRFAKSDYQRHSGRGVPLLVMGNKTLRGFRASSYDRFFED